MLAAGKRTEQQNAIYKDLNAFMSVYPEVKSSLKIVLEQLVRERPADPLGFMAIRLREINEDVKIERSLKAQAAVLIQSRARGIKSRERVTDIKETKQQRDEETKQAKAATDIQRISRGKKDRARAAEKKVVKTEMDNASSKIQSMQRKKQAKTRVDGIHKMNLVWLRELFLKLGGSQNPTP
ncbi:hypothetical protein T484DRAFT_2766782 [Baffinella frigidus]|nr:hypothetical protein T484DRAFT_2766782 [Cryptophyta sp. CCMP2293]